MEIKVWAHRGASGYAPENTLDAFLLAKKMGADGVELDVQLTRDGQLVVIHDEAIDRVSTGTGYVKDMTLAQLKKYNFNKTHPEYDSAVIPTLDEVLGLLEDSHMEVNIELKTGVFFYDGIEERVLRLANHMGMEGRIWYSSFNHGTLVRIKKLNPKARTGILYADGIYRPVDYGKTLGAEALHPSVYNLRYPGLERECRRQGLLLHAWTINCLEDMKLCTELGVEAAITNYPDLAREWLKEIDKGEGK